ncbi:DUF397 domain-containing protein [Streptomyces sp. NPDC005917]|uniref:DUF397 domain-containing protein n=1 Tax=unclassified Streptomyces TaxID=2593676 RepID=UPI0033E2DC9B
MLTPGAHLRVALDATTPRPVSVQDQHGLAEGGEQAGLPAGARQAGRLRRVADGVPSVVPVRDSKAPGGAVLLTGAAAWTEFIGAVGTAPAL